MTVDCGWTLPNRTSSGTLTWNPARFPNGFPALGQFIHNLGFGFGVYSDAGVQMCMTGEPAQVGSLRKLSGLDVVRMKLIHGSSRADRRRYICFLGG